MAEGCLLRSVLRRRTEVATARGTARFARSRASGVALCSSALTALVAMSPHHATHLSPPRRCGCATLRRARARAPTSPSSYSHRRFGKVRLIELLQNFYIYSIDKKLQQNLQSAFDLDQNWSRGSLVSGAVGSTAQHLAEAFISRLRRDERLQSTLGVAGRRKRRLPRLRVLITASSRLAGRRRGKNEVSLV